MERKSNGVQIAWWHSLMYSTGLLLIVGIPGSILAAFFIMADGRFDRSDAFLFGGCMVGAQVVIAGILLFVARLVSKHQDRISAKHDSDT
ncbi:MAG: hypothetical protein JWR26_167 [Pedosphaera sp.]|nr:hypothetical protein [Pedosphaera sp.]